MYKSYKKVRYNRRGIAMIIAMIFLAIFVSLSMSMLTMSSVNAKTSTNHRNANNAMNAALSGLDCAKYIAASTPTIRTGYNYVSTSEANIIWANLCTNLASLNLGNALVGEVSVFSDSAGTGEEITTDPIALSGQNTNFSLKFYRYNSAPSTIKTEVIGIANGLSRIIGMDMIISKNNKILNYAIASRGRMWVTGDSTIHGDIYSSWDRAEISPFNMTEDTTILGTVNTVLTKEQIGEQTYQLETLDEDGRPMFDENGDRIYGLDDEVQGYHRGINYDRPGIADIPGMNIDDYDTDIYKYDICYGSEGGGDIPSSSTITVEYFPHASGDYSQPRDGTVNNTWNRKLYRHTYENQSYDNVRLADNRNALFKNCTFEGVLYIDCYKSGSYKYNNVRFENCTFNGIIVTDVPEQFKWQNNCLYFTGEAIFQNTSDIQEATILAPGFNVNLGNTNPDSGEKNILTGAIIGGIVDVRGNAQILGTIISMWDTSQWSSGYVTNIGATLEDGGGETTDPGDVGVIEITPDDDKMLPSGITSPIVIKPVAESYYEGL